MTLRDLIKCKDSSKGVCKMITFIEMDKLEQWAQYKDKTVVVFDHILIVLKG